MTEPYLLEDYPGEPRTCVECGKSALDGYVFWEDAVTPLDAFYCSLACANRSHADGECS